jgi:hypothetical protein
MFPMFNVNDLYELLKTNSIDEVRKAFDSTLNAAEAKRQSAIYKYGTHELPTDFYGRLDTNDTTLEDVVLLLYTVLYRDYPEYREFMEDIDIAENTKAVADMLNVFGNLKPVVDGVKDKTAKLKVKVNRDAADKFIIDDFLSLFN